MVTGDLGSIVVFIGMIEVEVERLEIGYRRLKYGRLWNLDIHFQFPEMSF